MRLVVFIEDPSRIVKRGDYRFVCKGKSGRKEGGGLKKYSNEASRCMSAGAKYEQGSCYSIRICYNDLHKSWR